MKTLSKLFVVALLLGYCQFASAQKADFSKTSQLLDSLDTHQKFMGTVLLSEDGQIKFARSLGYADEKNAIKNVIQTQYHIGSISKMFTSVLIFQSIEDKKLSLDQPLADFFPNIPNAEKIQISHLLRHRSGIHNFTNDKNYLEYNVQPKSQEEMLEIIENGGSDFEPDTKASYSNSNYVLLSYILEKIHEKSYADILEKNIVRPLKLKNTRVFGVINPKAAESQSYIYNGGWVLEKETHPSIPMGAGAISSTAEELSIFATGLFEGKLVSEESLQQMMEMKEDYGYGLFTFPYHEKTLYGHTGGIDGFRSMLGYLPEEKVAIVTLSNGLNWDNNAIILAVLNGQYGNDVEIPSFQTYSVASEELDQYLGEYVSQEIPITFTFIKDGTTLIAKPSGQADTKLEATAKHQFEFSTVGAIFTFDPEKGDLIFEQGGRAFQYKKK